MHSLKDWQPLTFIGSAYILKWGDSVEGRGEEDKESVGDKGTGRESKLPQINISKLSFSSKTLFPYGT